MRRGKVRLKPDFWRAQDAFDLAHFFFWPLSTMITPPWSGLHLVLFLALSAAAFLYLSTPWPSPMWLIGFAIYGSVVPLISDDTGIPTFVLLGIFWVGLGGIGWYVLQYRHRDFIEKISRRFSGEPGPEPEPDEGEETEK